MSSPQGVLVMFHRLLENIKFLYMVFIDLLEAFNELVCCSMISMYHDDLVDQKGYRAEPYALLLSLLLLYERSYWDREGWGGDLTGTCTTSEAGLGEQDGPDSSLALNPRVGRTTRGKDKRWCRHVVRGGYTGRGARWGEGCTRDWRGGRGKGAVGLGYVEWERQWVRG